MHPERIVIGKILTLDEGISLSPYKDTKGYWTIGIGHFLGKDFHIKKLTPNEAVDLLYQDIENAFDEAYLLFGEEFIDTLPLAQKAAIISMLFNLGLPKFVKFYKMIHCINKRDWKGAARECKDSKWAHDVDPRDREGAGRDDRIAKLFLGQFDPYYDLDEKTLKSIKV